MEALTYILKAMRGQVILLRRFASLILWAAPAAAAASGQEGGEQFVLSRLIEKENVQYLRVPWRRVISRNVTGENIAGGRPCWGKGRSRDHASTAACSAHTVMAGLRWASDGLTRC